METKARSWAKSVVWRLLGFLILGVISYLFTGNWSESIGISSAFNLIRLVLYYYHERLWLKIHWGREVTAATRAPQIELSKSSFKP
ncbi:MAG: DUF2061 domain-containing protein [Acidobacteria bacterium]|nr:DUF2061 domain-containing protein [Acidobacteriota bacterium]